MGGIYAKTSYVISATLDGQIGRWVSSWMLLAGSVIKGVGLKGEGGKEGRGKREV